MTEPRASHARAPYVTANTRTEEIRNLWGREPTANELRAIAELPLVSKIYLDDDSENGKKAYQLLWCSELKRDASLLEEAGRLLWEQAMRLPPHWQSPAPPPLPLSDLPDAAYQFSTLSNDPFAKAGNVRTVEYKTVTLNIPNSLELNPKTPTESHLEEPEHTTYPDLLINPPERWLRESPHSPQPLRLIQLMACTNSTPLLQHHIQSQITAPIANNEGKKPSVSKTKNSAKAPDLNRARKPAVEPKPKTKASSNKLPSVQGITQQPAPLIVPTLPLLGGQQAYFAISSAAVSSKAHFSPYTANANEHLNVPAKVATHPQNNHALNPFLASQTRFPTSSLLGITPTAMQPMIGSIRNQHPCNPTGNQPPLNLPQTTRTPIMLRTSNQQDQVDMPWLQLTPGNYRSITAATEPLEKQPYDEVYRLAKETAHNVARMLAEQ